MDSAFHTGVVVYDINEDGIEDVCAADRFGCGCGGGLVLTLTIHSLVTVYFVGLRWVPSVKC